MYHHRYDMHETDHPVSEPGRSMNQHWEIPPRDRSLRHEGRIVAAAEMQLLTEYVREMTGFRLEKLAQILDDYRDDCRRNGNVTGMQRAAQNILELLGAAQPA